MRYGHRVGSTQGSRIPKCRHSTIATDKTERGASPHDLITTAAPALGRVTIGKAIKLTGASRNTLKQHFRTLVERGTLNQHGSGRGVWYDLH